MNELQKSIDASSASRIRFVLLKRWSSKKLMKKPFAIFALALSTALVSNDSLAQASPSPSATPEKLKLERVGKFDGNIKFPDVEGWTRGEKHEYPVPEFGYSVTYQSRSGRVTVYVYNAGLKKIPNALTGPVADQMATARKDIKAMVAQGGYDSSTEGKVETVYIGGTSGKVKALHTAFTLKAKGNEFDSETYVFPYNDYFIKIRMTRPKAAAGIEDLQELMRSLDEVFAI